MNRWRDLGLALACATVLACSGSDESGSGQCEAGETAECACGNGTMGSQQCADGAFQPCSCGPGTPTTGTGGTQGEPDPMSDPEPAGRQPIIPPVTEECPAFVNGTITFMGLPGIEIVAGAPPPSPTAPMVFYWHGTGSTSAEFNALAVPVRDGVVAEGGVLVSFQGTTGGDILSGTSVFGASDFPIVDQLVACAVRDHNIDPRRIFTTGCSAGGLYSGALAAMRSNYFAAVAPNSGGVLSPPEFQNDFTPALMTVHGAAGVDVVIVDFAEMSLRADEAYGARGGFVVNCDHGGGHCGGAGLAGDVWQFFQAHPYGTEPSPWAGGLPPGFSGGICQIF